MSISAGPVDVLKDMATAFAIHRLSAVAGVECGAAHRGRGGEVGAFLLIAPLHTDCAALGFVVSYRLLISRNTEIS